MKRNRLTLTLYWLLQFTWGLPQSLCGLLLFLGLLVCGPRRKLCVFHGAAVIHWRFPYSMALGPFIFFGHGGTSVETAAAVHEWGHTVQSVILGPLYLAVVGLPSALWCLLPPFRRLRRTSGVRYTDLYCEKWASRTGERLTGTPALWI
jgi:hypothetical protein